MVRHVEAPEVTTDMDIGHTISYGWMSPSQLRVAEGDSSDKNTAYFSSASFWILT